MACGTGSRVKRPLVVAGALAGLAAAVGDGLAIGMVIEDENAPTVDTGAVEDATTSSDLAVPRGRVIMFERSPGGSANRDETKPGS
jgi:hypothetical protein